jgi:hypothetical protein
MLTVLLLIGQTAFHAPDLYPPTRLEAEGKPIDVDAAHAAPHVHDMDGDGLPDLLVGQFGDGKLRVYRNLGKRRAPVFERFDWVMAGDRVATVPFGCCIGFVPRLADLDGDGRLDLVSGSLPGEMYWFPGLPGRRFAPGRRIVDADDKPITTERVVTVTPFDWDRDGRSDLIVGTQPGPLVWMRNLGGARFGNPQRIMVENEPISGDDLAPAMADWDGDGVDDLFVGDAQGRVRLYRITRPGGRTRLSAPIQLIAPVRPEYWSQGAREPRSGVRVRLWVGDWDGDGKTDLLVGDLSVLPAKAIADQEALGAKALEAEQELEQLGPLMRAEQRRLIDEAYRRLGLDRDRPIPAEREREFSELFAQLRDGSAEYQRLWKRFQELQGLVRQSRPAPSTHGFVWLYRRR